MDERAREWAADKARDVQGWVQDRTQALPPMPWARGEVPQQTGWIAPGAMTAPMPAAHAQVPAPAPGFVPNPMAGGGPDDQQPGERTRRWPKRVLIGAGLVGILALGSCMGRVGSVDELSSLEGEVTSLTSQVAATSADNDELQTLMSQQGDDLAAAQDEVEAVEATLESTEADLSTAEADLTAAQTTISERDATIASLEAQLSEAQTPAPAAAAAPAAAPAAAAPAAAAPAAAAPAPAAAPYYANCSAVRAAGAAPISAGQPGYGRHLDRDGDGIACE